jgi:hypothetical protein
VSARLQELLTLGLVDIEDSGERFNHLDKAAATLADHFKAAPAEAIPAILTGMDDSASDDDPVLVRAEQAVTEHWKLLRNRFNDRPRALLRIVVLDALERAAAENARVRAAAAMTATSVLERVQLGREDAAVRAMVQQWVTLIEDEAAAAWQSELELPDPPVPKKALGAKPVAPQFSQQQFRPSIDLVSGPQQQGPQGARNFPNANPHWPQGGAPWVHEFATRMTDAMVTAANTISAGVTSALAAALNQDREQLSQEVVAPFASFATDVARSIRASQLSAMMRLDLLWWKEALYSPAARASYRTMPTAAGALLMAQDLLGRIAVPAPEAVTAFLRETVLGLGRDAQEKRTLGGWLSQIHAGASLRRLIAAPEVRPGRIPLGHVLRQALHGAVSGDDLRARTGLRDGIELTLPELAAWFFRDELAARIAEVRDGA